MFKSALFGIGTSAVAVAALTFPGEALGQRHDGGHGGSHGSGHASVGHAGNEWRSGYYGRYDWDRGRSWGYGALGIAGYPYYGLYPSYYPYSYYPSYYSGYYSSYYRSSYAPDYTYGTLSDYAREPDYNSGSYRTTVSNNTALITVQVPDPDAKVWFNGQLASQRGSLREFVSPALEPGRPYTYDIRAQWTRNGRTADQTQHVQFEAGHQELVNFNEAQPPARAAEPVQAPAPASR